jgi:hypothetical protein
MKTLCDILKQTDLEIWPSMSKKENTESTIVKMRAGKLMAEWTSENQRLMKTLGDETK